MTSRSLLVCSALVLGAVARAADAPPEGEARLREALRNATLQFRSVEAERTNLQTANAALTEEKRVLAEKFETLRKQTVADRATDDKAIVALKSQTTAQEAEIAHLKEALEKSEAGGKQSAALAAAKETDRAKLAADLVVLQRKVEDRETRNLALFKLGNEILTRYEKFSLGEALAAREPFVGTVRAKLENLVQDYQDQLLEQRAKP